MAADNHVYIFLINSDSPQLGLSYMYVKFYGCFIRLLSEPKN